ncbi:hypothetical protein [Holospora undulata]|uniref:Uncharacterized protein n=1 Tax=Holospora undulata HU1 TaxID=1321371 RepID=A0A061JGX8_9PROT|nr:hypothetical protein [Holospora undulata]ETZ05360.1 hypothetical protein K737_300212 [Holospora undulata HU1]
MTKSHSNDLKQRVTEYLDEGAGILKHRTYLKREIEYNILNFNAISWFFKISNSNQITIYATPKRCFAYLIPEALTP